MENANNPKKNSSNCSKQRHVTFSGDHLLESNINCVDPKQKTSQCNEVSDFCQRSCSRFDLNTKDSKSTMEVPSNCSSHCSTKEPEKKPSKPKSCLSKVFCCKKKKNNATEEKWDECTCQPKKKPAKMRSCLSKMSCCKKKKKSTESLSEPEYDGYMCTKWRKANSFLRLNPFYQNKRNSTNCTDISILHHCLSGHLSRNSSDTSMKLSTRELGECCCELAETKSREEPLDAPKTSTDESSCGCPGCLGIDLKKKATIQPKEVEAKCSTCECPACKISREQSSHTKEKPDCFEDSFVFQEPVIVQNCQCSCPGCKPAAKELKSSVGRVCTASDKDRVNKESDARRPTTFNVDIHSNHCSCPNCSTQNKFSEPAANARKSTFPTHNSSEGGSQRTSNFILANDSSITSPTSTTKIGLCSCPGCPRNRKMTVSYAPSVESMRYRDGKSSSLSAFSATELPKCHCQCPGCQANRYSSPSDQNIETSYEREDTDFSTNESLNCVCDCPACERYRNPPSSVSTSTDSIEQDGKYSTTEPEYCHCKCPGCIRTQICQSNSTFIESNESNSSITRNSSRSFDEHSPSCKCPGCFANRTDKGSLSRFMGGKNHITFDTEHVSDTLTEANHRKRSSSAKPNNTNQRRVCHGCPLNRADSTHINKANPPRMFDLPPSITKRSNSSSNSTKKTVRFADSLVSVENNAFIDNDWIDKSASLEDERPRAARGKDASSILCENYIDPNCMCPACRSVQSKKNAGCNNFTIFCQCTLPKEGDIAEFYNAAKTAIASVTSGLSLTCSTYAGSDSERDFR